LFRWFQRDVMRQFVRSPGIIRTSESHARQHTFGFTGNGSPPMGKVDGIAIRLGIAQRVDGPIGAEGFQPINPSGWQSCGHGDGAETFAAGFEAAGNRGVNQFAAHVRIRPFGSVARAIARRSYIRSPWVSGSHGYSLHDSSHYPGDQEAIFSAWQG